MYPNDDEVSYVSIVYDARVASGTPAPDMDEVLEVGWFADDEIASLDLDAFNRTLLEHVRRVR